MDDLIILGLDIHAIEVIDIINMTGRYNVLGIIDERAAGAERLQEYMGCPVLGGPDAIARYPNAYRTPMHGWKERSDRRNWVSIISPTSFVASSAKLGAGCIVYPNCFIGANAILGDGVFMLSGSVVNHDCKIGDGVVITTGVALAGCVTVKAGAYLGQACTVKQYLTIGEKCYIGMGGVVTRDVPDGVTVVGCPARPYIKA